MESSVLTEVALPLAIFLIMVAMGMSLTPADFGRLRSQPKPVLVGLACQLVMLPVVGFAVAAVFGLEAVFAVSIVLLAASPGGTTSNLIVHVADGDRALSITLTAISNMVVFLLLPVELGLAERVFGEVNGEAAVPIVDLMVPVAALTLLPVAIGMTVRARRPATAVRLEDAGKIFSGVVLGVVVLAITVQEWDAIVENGPAFAPAFVALNAIALLAGFGIARGLGIGRVQSMTIGVEAGMQNSTIAITIALTVFDNPELSIVPGLYGVWMLATGFAFAIALRGRHGEREPLAGVVA